MATSKSLRSRARQTRLTFTPLPSSSPAPKSSFIPAAVGYEGSPARKRRKVQPQESEVQVKVESGNDDSVTQSNILPTPAKSSQLPSRLSHTEIKQEQTSSSDSEDQPILPSARKQRSQGPSAWRDRAQRDQPKLAFTNPPSTLKNSPSPPPPSSSRRAKQAVVIESSDEEDESDEMVGSRRANMGRRRKRTTPRDDRQEQDDIEEDLDFLRSSPPATTTGTLKRKHDARESALAALKRRRAGRESVALEPSIEEDEEEGQDEDEEDEDEADSASEAEERPQALNSEIGGRGGWQSERIRDEPGLDNFIVSDDEEEEADPGEMPADAVVPIHLTSFARMKAKDLFRFVVEWMVQKKLNPAFLMRDELYTLAFNKVEDEVKGLVDSKFTSSAWTRDFTVALQGRPDMEIVDLRGGIVDDHCHACNRKSHPATYQISFIGRPYDFGTLDEVGGASDEDSDDDDSDDEDENNGGNEDDADEEEPTAKKAEYDSKGRLMPLATQKYAVGKFCMRNASTAHALHHWRIHLFEFIVDYLQTAGILDAQNIVERDSWTTKKRRKYANTVTDQMVDNGEVKKLWRDFRAEIDAARNARQAGNFTGRI